MVFDKNWFNKHQKLLLKFANSLWGRRVLRINGDRSSVGKNKIVEIGPSHITWVKKQTSKKTYFSSEFRTSDKFAARLYHAFKPLWLIAHAFDMGIANNLDERLNLGFDTLTAYPDPNPETSTVDGRAVRNNSGTETMAVIRAGAGTSGEPSTANDLTPALVASSTTNQFSILTRGIRLFNTSSLPDTATITTAVFSEYVTSKTNGLSGEASANSAIVLVASTPASNTDIVAADYSQLGSTEFGRSDTQNNLTTSAYNAITLNATGIAAISKTGITKFGTRIGWDFDNTITGLTHSNGAIQGVNVNHADTAGTTTDPKLVVTYAIEISIADSMGLTDDLEYQKLAIYSRSIADSMGITDNINYELLLIVYRSIADDMGITDNIDYDLLTVILRSIAESMGLVDSLDYTTSRLPVVAIKPHFYNIFSPNPTGKVKTSKAKVRNPYRRMELNDN